MICSELEYSSVLDGLYDQYNIHANNCDILIVLLIDECYGWTVLVDNKSLKLYTKQYVWICNSLIYIILENGFKLKNIYNILYVLFDRYLQVPIVDNY